MGQGEGLPGDRSDQGSSRIDRGRGNVEGETSGTEDKT